MKMFVSKSFYGMLKNLLNENSMAYKTNQLKVGDNIKVKNKSYKVQSIGKITEVGSILDFVIEKDGKKVRLFWDDGMDDYVTHGR